MISAKVSLICLHITVDVGIQNAHHNVILGCLVKKQLQFIVKVFHFIEIVYLTDVQVEESCIQSSLCVCVSFAFNTICWYILKLVLFYYIVVLRFIPVRSGLYIITKSNFSTKHDIAISFTWMLRIT